MGAAWRDAQACGKGKGKATGEDAQLVRVAPMTREQREALRAALAAHEDDDE